MINSHFSNNKLSGPIPENLFSSQLTLLHILFDGNQFTGGIPTSIALVQSLEALRLDRNSLDGTVPLTINKLRKLRELNLANNKLTGPMPNLAGMDNLNYVDLSNNTFDSSEAPVWLSTIQSLTTIVIESGGLYGEVPQKLFSLPQLQEVILDNNQFNGTFNMGSNISNQLKMVNFRNNIISLLNPNSTYSGILILAGNPVCHGLNSDASFCNSNQTITSYSTSLSNCSNRPCSPNQNLSPRSCECAYAYDLLLVFRAPYFRDVANVALFKQLEANFRSLGDAGLTDGSAFIERPYIDQTDYLTVPVKLFPPTGMYFNQSNIIDIYTRCQELQYPVYFGTYYSIAVIYTFAGTGGSSISRVTLIGLIVCSIVLVIGLVLLGIYAFQQKKKAERAVKLIRPFASWASTGRGCDAPQLKETKCFSFDELKKNTNNFSENNIIGIGGFGKVYLGMFPGGESVAIKRLRRGSMHGGLEFKTEIELLSRVHHKNLVSLIGFCFDQGEEMLVYEFIPNGSLRENLAWRRGIQLEWKTRLGIALGSARGLAYLHEHANPPIIHRDVKSTNILLDVNLEAKVADFGLSKLVSDIEMEDTSTDIKGTMGYLDPDYFTTQQLTEKSDVYSFGVVMLELVTAKQPLENKKYMVLEVKMAIDPNDEEYCGLKELMDPVLRNTTNLVGFRRFVQLAMQCVGEVAACRPAMSDIVKEMEIILQNDGANTELDLPASSATVLKNMDGISIHPYDDKLPAKDSSSCAFTYSGGYSFPVDIEPK